jgi:hypothetical protein
MVERAKAKPAASSPVPGTLDFRLISPFPDDGACPNGHIPAHEKTRRPGVGTFGKSPRSDRSGI